MKVSSIRQKRIMVTGSAGVIGRELLRMLIEEGASILSIDRNPLPDGDWQGVCHIQKDLAIDSLDELCDFQPQMVFHLAAAFERTTESPWFWDTNWHDNSLLSHRIVNLIKELHDLDVFLLASSYLVYSSSLYLSQFPNSDVVFLSENDPVSPRNLCGAAKYYTENEINFLKRVLTPDLRVIYARIFRVYGCGSKDVISRWAHAALLDQDIEVFNEENRFDFIFARDVAEGLLRLVQCPDADGPVNLGTGVARSIQDVLDSVAECVPMTPLRIQELDIKDAFEASCADLAKLKQLTGWAPTTDLVSGVKVVMEFERKRLDEEARHE